MTDDHDTYVRKKLLEDLITHFKQVIENGKGVTYNHPINYQWMYGGVVNYLEELHTEEKHD